MQTAKCVIRERTIVISVGWNSGGVLLLWRIIYIAYLYIDFVIVNFELDCKCVPVPISTYQLTHHQLENVNFLNYYLTIIWLIQHVVRTHSSGTINVKHFFQCLHLLLYLHGPMVMGSREYASGFTSLWCKLSLCTCYNSVLIFQICFRNLRVRTVFLTTNRSRCTLTLLPDYMLKI